MCLFPSIGRTGKPQRRGFTLIETLMATTMSTLLMAAVLSAYAMYSRAYWRNAQANSLQRNVRSGVDMIARDLRAAGYGVPRPYSTLDTWVSWMSGITNPVIVVKGPTSNDSDRVILTGVLDEPVSTLGLSSAPGDTTIHVETGTGNRFNLFDRKLLFIGQLEHARIVSISGDALTITVSPSTSGVGLKNGYPPGASIELVSVTTYECNPSPAGFPFTPYLLRYINQSTPPIDVAEGIAALDIELFQVALNPTQVVDINLRGRTPLQDGSYAHPVFGDGYRRQTLATRVFPRNLP